MRVGVQMLRRAFQYNWRLWTIPELREMLLAAGFHSVHAWLRPMKVWGHLMLFVNALRFFGCSVRAVPIGKRNILWPASISKPRGPGW